MKQQHVLLTEASRMVGVKPYKVLYAIQVGYICEPQRIGNKRIFGREDLARLAAHFGRQIGPGETFRRSDGHPE